jgi:predicted nucleic acid-binding protein
MILVVDASVVVDILLRTPGSERVFDRLFGRRDTLHAPHLLDVEVTQVLRRYVARGEVDDTHGRGLVALLGTLPIARYPHGPLLSRAWELRANLTAYDAVYAALAEGLRGTLVTRDARLASAAGVRAVVDVL